ncbi:MAG: beta-glucosidase [Aphanocapsa sp. GSE-SYN-MK-11-07L]|jgi:beta-glucosidase|nr:beta-glucosidase [Aphanocapsa sp. GSE-SYN-MK-11-07L]
MTPTPLLPDLDQLALPLLVAQLLVVRASGYLFDHQIRYPQWEPKQAQLRYWLQELGLGGVILLGGSAGELALRSQQLQTWAKIPLLLSADIEEGVGQRFAGATWFPPPMALGAIARHEPDKAADYATKMGAYTAQEALAIGLNWVLAPVVDVNNNPDNPVINVRAFAETAAEVARLTTAFIEGMQAFPVLSTAKHFPGHGDTATDSHLDLPVLPHSLARLAEVELVPFQAAIAAGVDGIMSAHLQIPSLDPDAPATLSQLILTEELRHRLGFQGLIVTDALIMRAIADRYGPNEAPLLALEAGADILLMPVDPEGAIRAICDAVHAGRVARERIQASVERLWQAKQKVCGPLLHNTHGHDWETQPLPTIELEHLSSSGAIASASGILKAAMTVQEYLAPVADGQNVIVVDDLLGCDFLDRVSPALALPADFGFNKLLIIDAHTPDFSFSAPIKQPTLLQLFIRGNPFRGSAGLTQTAKAWFDFLLETNQLRGLVIYGSPYVLEQFLPHLPTATPYAFTYGQMPLAQAIVLKALFQP